MTDARGRASRIGFWGNFGTGPAIAERFALSREALKRQYDLLFW